MTFKSLFVQIIEQRAHDKPAVFSVCEHVCDKVGRPTLLVHMFTHIDVSNYLGQLLT